MYLLCQIKKSLVLRDLSIITMASRSEEYMELLYSATAPELVHELLLQLLDGKYHNHFLNLVFA
jgi:hypothetical protein